MGELPPHQLGGDIFPFTLMMTETFTWNIGLRWYQRTGP